MLVKLLCIMTNNTNSNEELERARPDHDSIIKLINLQIMYVSMIKHLFFVYFTSFKI